MMNKFPPMINLVENAGDKHNLMESIKNLDAQLEDAINDLRMQKILSKKESERAKEIIHNIIW